MIAVAWMANTANGTVDLPRLSRVATIVPRTINDEDRTVDVVWTTGSRVLRGFFEQYWEELSLDPKAVRMKRLNNGAPLLNAHNGYDAADVVGVVQSGTAVIDGKRGIATVRFAKAEDDPAADAIYRKVKDGILQNISVGYQTYRLEKISDGGADKIPIYEATDWEPYELSVVPIGADDGAGFRAATTELHPCVFITRQQKQQERKTMADEDNETGTKSGDDSPAVVATRAAERARQEEAAVQGEAAQRAAQEAITKERRRSVEIRGIAAQSRLGEAWATTLIDAGTTVEEARKAAFEHLTNADSKSPTEGLLRVGAGDDARDKWIRGASAWLLERSNHREMLEAAKVKMPRARQFKELDFESGYGDFAGMTPAELARDSLERAGVRTRGMDKMTMIGMAFTHRSGNFQTTSDFGTLLEVSLGKILLGSYATQENTWEKITKRDQVPDFRTSNRYRTGSIQGLDVILEHGEYQNGKIPDGAKYGIGTQRTGKIFGLSREAIVNDDMGALTNLAAAFGSSASRTIETSVYALIALNSGLGPTQADAQPFFHANRANVNATGSALSVAGLDADRVTLRAQKDPNGLDFLDLRPDVLLVPDSLYGQAQVINESQYDTDKITNGRNQEPNRVRGLFRLVVGTPRLTGTRRYLITPQMDWIVVAFLEGYPGPVLESQQGWRVDGVEWKVTVYAKAQAGDPKAAMTNAGA